MLISDWSSDVCASYLIVDNGDRQQAVAIVAVAVGEFDGEILEQAVFALDAGMGFSGVQRIAVADLARRGIIGGDIQHVAERGRDRRGRENAIIDQLHAVDRQVRDPVGRSEEHTSELQSLMRLSYAVFC